MVNCSWIDGSRNDRLTQSEFKMSSLHFTDLLSFKHSMTISSSGAFYFIKPNQDDAELVKLKDVAAPWHPIAGLILYFWFEYLHKKPIFPLCLRCAGIWRRRRRRNCAIPLHSPHLQNRVQPLPEHRLPVP